MSRPTHIYIHSQALMHNLLCVKAQAPKCKIIAMVKANAYGCGLANVVPILEGQVDAFGVASLEEALNVRALGAVTPCVLFQGIFKPEEIPIDANNNCQIVLHQHLQLQWLLNTKLPIKIKIWLKVDTGMHRLGFAPSEVGGILASLNSCAWVNNEIGIMSHLANADYPAHLSNAAQMDIFASLPTDINLIKSLANSAATLAFPNAHYNVVRPGIMLYGVSPFHDYSGVDLGLMPVMHFVSAISAIHHYPAGITIGYGGRWQSNRPSIIGVIPAGYGDGFPRHLKVNTKIWVKENFVPIVGAVSMDMLSVDLTDTPAVEIGDAVELWGSKIPVESIAVAAGTIPYELLCQVSERVRQYAP